MSRKIILIKQELLLLVYELNRSGLLAENEKIRPILAQLEKLLLCDLSPSTNDSVKNSTEANPNELNQDDARYGFRCCHLKNIWTAPLPPETELSRQMTTSTTSIDIM